jgi:hypothetical protein
MTPRHAAAVVTLGALSLALPSPPAEAAAGPRPPAGKRLEPAAVLRVAEAWWTGSPYEYMFAEAAPTVRVNGRDYGMMQGGINGILDYGSLSAAFARVVLSKPTVRFGDRSPIEAVSGLRLIARKASSYRHDFNRYNAHIVTWGAAWLIPDPQAKILGVPAQLLYDRVFRRFFRLMAASHRHLDRAGAWDGERAAYLSAMQAPGFEGLAWLEQRFAGALPEYAPAAIGGSPMTPAMALGFWVRRSEDGTEPALWRALQGLLRRFDRAWADQLLAP